MIPTELPLAFVVGLTALVGLCVGSFLNVVIYRTPKEMAITGASHCPACNTRLRARELVPLASWLFLRGQCAHCKAKISWRYPCIELATAILWAACALHWRDPASALAWCLFCSALLTLAMIDWDTTLLPDSLTLPLLWVGLVASTINLTEIQTSQAVWGAFVGYGFLWLVSVGFESFTGKVGIGGGDLKFLGAVGAWLGPISTLVVILLASIVGVVVGLILKRHDRLREGAYIPFGPFLACSAILLTFTGRPWVFI